MSKIEGKKNPILPIFITVLIDMLGVGIIIPIFAPLIVKNEHGILSAATPEATKNMLYGLLTAMFAIFQFFGAPVLGALADRYGRKKILQISLFGTLIGYVLFAFAIYYKNLYMLFLARAVPGFMGGNIAIVLAALSDVSKPQEKSKNFGLVGLAFGLGFILGPFLGGVLSSPQIISWFDYSTPLWFTALLTLSNIYFVKSRFPDTYVPQNPREVYILQGFRNVGRAFRYQELRPVLLSLFLQAFGFSFFMQFFQVYLIHRFSYNQQQIGILFGYIGLWIAFTQGVINRRVASGFLPPSVLSFSLLGMAVSLLLILIPSNPVFLYLFHPLIAISQGLTQPNFTSLVSSLASSDEQGEILGIQQSVQSLAFAIPPLIAGFAVSIDYRLPILMGAAFLFLAWLNFMIKFDRKAYQSKAF